MMVKDAIIPGLIYVDTFTMEWEDPKAVPVVTDETVFYKVLHIGAEKLQVITKSNYGFTDLRCISIPIEEFCLKCCNVDRSLHLL